MQWGRFYRQIRPWALCANFPPRYKTPVAIFPYFVFQYAGGQIAGEGRQTIPPFVDLRHGLVRWHGEFSSGVFDGSWDIEQLQEDHSPNIKFTLLLRDNLASLLIQKNIWLAGFSATWANVPFFPMGEMYDWQATGFFEFPGLVTCRPRNYSEE